MAIRRQNKNSKPAAKKPAAKKTVSKKPAAKKPAAKKTVSKKPVSKKPVAKKPAAKKPAAKKIVIDNAPPKIRVKRKMYEYEKIATNAKGNLFHLMGQRVQRGEVKWAYYTIEEGDMGYHYYIKLK